MLTTQKIPKNITECIEILAYNDQFWEGFASHHKDRQTIRSLAEAVYPWTEKQAKLGLVIIKRYKTLFEKFKLDISDLCESPVWRDPFRKIDYEKAIEKYTNEEREDVVEIKFPYSKKMITLIRCLKDKRGLPQGYLRYNGETKVWTGTYSDVVAYYLTLIGIRYDFKFIDQTMLDDFDTIRTEIKKHKHMKVYAGKKNLAITNAPESLTEYWNKKIRNRNLLQQIDSLKTFNLSLPQNWLKEKGITLAEKIAISSSREVHISRMRWNRNQLLSACEELRLFPLLVPITDISNAEDIRELTNWFHAFTEQGIPDKQVAWGFDLAKYPLDPPEQLTYENGKSWDDPYSHLYTKDMTKDQRTSLFNEFKTLHERSTKNKFIDKNTKIIFIRNKIPRTLVKSDITPTTCLNWCNYSYAPYSDFIRKWLDNIDKRLYYSSSTDLKEKML